MSDQDIIDEYEHDALLQDIRRLDKQKKATSVSVKPSKKKVKFDEGDILDELVGAISSTR
jgi:hypothetical protein